MSDEQRVTDVDVGAYTVPTDSPEADGTLAWDVTTIVVVTVRTRAGVTGIGHTYGHECLASLISGLLAPRVVGVDVRETVTAWEAMPTNLRHIEYFHDHVRIEHLLLDGVVDPVQGHLVPAEVPGNGLAFKEADAERFRVR